MSKLNPYLLLNLQYYEGAGEYNSTRQVSIVLDNEGCLSAVMLTGRPSETDLTVNRDSILFQPEALPYQGTVK